MNKDHTDPRELDLTKPRLCIVQAEEVERHQDTVYWVDTQLAQRKGLKFYQTRSNAVILHNTLPAYCVSRVVVMNSEEKSYTRRFLCHLDHHRKFPTKIIGCVIQNLMSLEAAKITNESNQNQEPNYQVRRDPYVGKSPQRKIEKRTMFDHDTLGQEKHDDVTDLNKYGEIRMWIRIHKALRVDTYTC